MNSAILFIVAVILLAILAVIIAYRGPVSAYKYLRTEQGEGVLLGIVLFVAVGLAIALLTPQKARADDGTWLAYGEVYLGLDYTKHQSPQCHAGGYDERSTSNGGIRQNIYLSGDRRFHANFKYTHHSCAFNPDRESYDSIGVELTYRFFSR